jgi:hypothetical protein
MLDLRIPGLPDWAALVLLVVGLTIVLAWVLMPFSVFGVKGRIEALEARLEVMHDELRQLNTRLAQGPAIRSTDFAMPAESPILRSDPLPAPEPRITPPIPPPPVVPERSMRPPAALRPEPIVPQAARAEPKLSWPPRG